jgi:hypothetical protein
MTNNKNNNMQKQEKPVSRKPSMPKSAGGTPLIPPDAMYLTKRKTGLPFDVIKNNHFDRYTTRDSGGRTGLLTKSDIIHIHILIELKEMRANIQRLGTGVGRIV